jgi:hypothetical protein
VQAAMVSAAMNVNERWNRRIDIDAVSYRAKFCNGTAKRALLFRQPRRRLAASPHQRNTAPWWRRRVQCISRKVRATVARDFPCTPSMRRDFARLR